MIHTCDEQVGLWPAGTAGDVALPRMERKNTGSTVKS